ncbi:MAG TPA: CapA family protein [Desulfomonilia bacterium]|nr:CapA family protein [Desulfomonilia bacterium]
MLQEVDAENTSQHLVSTNLHKICATVCLVLIVIEGYPGLLFSDNLYSRMSSVNTVLSVGDIMLSGSSKPYLKAKGYDFTFQDTTLAKVISGSGAAFCNLEYPITDQGDRYEDKTYTFRGEPDSLKAIKKAGFNLISLANNHTMDYGEKGLIDTLRQCRKNRIVYAGAGTDLTSACRLGILRKSGVRYGILAYSFTFPEEFWATPEKAGTAHPDWGQVGRDIRDARLRVDILIVSCHWGEELKENPKKYQIDFAHHAINAGADIVAGHHPHIPQPIEIYKGKPIFYSLGNYAFGAVSDKVTFSFAALTRFRNRVPVWVDLYPVNVHNREVCFQPVLAKGSSAKNIISYLRDISKPFGTHIRFEQGRGRIIITPGCAEPRSVTEMNGTLTVHDTGLH